MHIVFLGARLPLTKTFVSDGGVISASPYPHVSKVTSYHEQAADLPAFKALLETHAARRHCLFNGQLLRPLKDESRAGMTQQSPREWVVFDFDKVDAKDHAEVVAKFLPAECQNVSYVVQLSASMFRPDNSSWSGHVYMLLDAPIDAARLRQWFEHLNFTVPALREGLTLSDSMQALRWPLDRTVAYDSKLIYIASPKCHGFEPAVQQHISLVRKRQQKLAIAAFQPIDQYMIRQRINELRRDAGVGEISYETSMFEGHEILRNAAEVEINGARTSGDHYIRFNINGGDSYAYFIDLRNPEIIRNFKGEPYLATKDAAPDLYKALKRHAPTVAAKPPLEDGSEVLAFYASNQGSAIKIGVFDPVGRKLTINGASETAARAWRAAYGLMQKEFLPHYDLVFDPKSEVQFLAESTRINTFRITDYMARDKSSDKPSSLTDLPPIARKILYSVLGSPEDALVEHFVNWMAYIFQRRAKTGTAWVLNGVEGTGKGTLLTYYLRPILGSEHVATVQYPNLRGEYNAFLEHSLLVAIEEADIKAVENAEDMMAKVKLWITDSPLPIRKMRTDVYDADNYSNFLLFTNTRTPALVSSSDRRFNFGERQDVPIQFTPNELKAIFAGAELDVFADTLKRWPVDEVAVTKVMDSQARQDAHEATTTINQLVAEAILKGDLQFFTDRMPSDVEAAADFSNGRFNPIGLYKALMDEFAEAGRKGEHVVLKDEQLFVMFRTIIPDPRYFQDSKTWRRRHYKSLGLDLDKQQRVPGEWDKRTRGITVTWDVPADYKADAASDDGKVTPIKKRKANADA